MDFYCAEKKLIVEIDGGYHIERQEEDALRDKILTEQGYNVIRFTNHHVDNSLEDVLVKIGGFVKWL